MTTPDQARAIDLYTSPSPPPTRRWKLGHKRCDCVQCTSASTIEQTEEDCGWIMFGEYKAEVDRFKAEVAKWHTGHNSEYDLRMQFFWMCQRHEETNARLRKAGDAMAIIICPPAHGPGEHDSEWLDWQAAKDGNKTK